MNTFFKRIRKANMDKIGKYLLYAFGEIILIILGILIAVNINEWQSNKKDNVLRCHYIDELQFAINHDIEDVESNISAYNDRIPEIKIFIDAASEKRLSQLDSLTEIVNTIGEYVFFVQQSKSKLEELKYAKINLILNRDLKNKLMYYQDSEVAFILDQEFRMNKIDDEIDKYFISNNGFLNIKDLEADVYFQSLALQKLNFSRGMLKSYQRLNKELLEIQEMIKIEQEKCHQ